MSTLLCVPIMVQDGAQALEDAARARDAGADIVEFRLDEFFSGSGDEREVRECQRIVGESPLPCIATCRPTWEGGGYDGGEDERVSLFQALGTVAPAAGRRPPAYIDVELAAYTRSENIRQKVHLAIGHPDRPRDVATRLLLSAHDFDGRPADLSRRVVRMQGEPAAAVVKVAFRARSVRDNLELFDLVSAGSKPMIALGMGEFGVASRVLAPKFGAFLTFAALRPGAGTAPGQPTVAELRGLYRFGAINARTRVYGVVGWPVTQSLSPAVHNAGFEGVGHDGVYVPLPVAPGYESLKATLLELIGHPRLDFAGCSVTIPHKEDLARLAADEGWETDALTRACGAANTVAVERDGDGVAVRVRVRNTDGPAAADVLARALGEAGGSRDGARVGILGAGGAAGAIAAELLARGGAVVVFNRTPERADALVERLSDTVAGARGRVGARGLGDVARAGSLAAIVNCTPLGMHGGPAPGSAAVDEASLRAVPGLRVVFDTVYNPAETPLLAMARTLGMGVVGGLGMFVAQAAAQFELWTGRAGPRGLFERVARERLE